MQAFLTIDKKSYPFRLTPEGAKILTDMQVDVESAKLGYVEDLKRYAYAIAAGAAAADALPFDYNVDDFIAACEPDWKTRAMQLLVEMPENKTNKSEENENNDQPEGKRISRIRN